MPIIEFHLLEGRTPEQKRNLCRDVSQTVAKSLGVSIETVRIIIHDMPAHNFSAAGVLAADRPKANGDTKQQDTGARTG